MTKKKKEKKVKVEKLPPEAEEEPKILTPSKYEEEPVILTKSRYEDEQKEEDKSEL